MTKPSAELRLIDSEMARLRAKRKLVELRERSAHQAEGIARLTKLLDEERARTTPDSINAMSDLTLSRKLADANAEIVNLRGRLKTMEADSQRLADTRVTIERFNAELLELRQRPTKELAQRWADKAAADAVAADRVRITTWLRGEADDEATRPNRDDVSVGIETWLREAEKFVNGELES